MKLEEGKIKEWKKESTRENTWGNTWASVSVHECVCAFMYLDLKTFISIHVFVCSDKAPPAQRTRHRTFSTQTDSTFSYVLHLDWIILAPITRIDELVKQDDSWRAALPDLVRERGVIWPSLGPRLHTPTHTYTDAHKHRYGSPCAHVRPCVKAILIIYLFIYLSYLSPCLKIYLSICIYLLNNLYSDVYVDIVSNLRK